MARLNRQERMEILLIVLVAIAVIVIYAQSMLGLTKGRIVFPVDDSYIYFQYAKQFSSGHPFQYCTGDEPTTGATSLLYHLLLSGFYSICPYDYGLVLIAFGFGSFLFVCSALLVYAILRIQVDDWHIPLVGGILFALTGSISWGYLSGMEIGLMSTLILLVILTLLSKPVPLKFPFLLLVLSCLAISRPEATLLSLIFVISLLCSRRVSRLRKAFLLIPILVIVIWFVLNKELTGIWTPTSGRAKANVMFFPDLYHIRKALDFLIGIIKGIYGASYDASALVGSAGLCTHRYFPPLSLAIFLLGVISTRNQHNHPMQRNVWIAVFAGFIVGHIAVGATISSGFHNFRYLIPYFPLYLMFVVFGFHEIARLLGRIKGIAPVTVVTLVSLYFVSFMMLSTGSFVLDYASHSAAEQKTTIACANWIRDNTQQDDRIGLVDAGALAYLSHRPIVDLLGLVTRRFTEVAFHGPGAVFECLEAEDPGVGFIVLQQSFCKSCLTLSRLFPILRSELLFRAEFSDGPEMSVYRIDTDIFQSGTHPVVHVEGNLIDEVDIADIESERCHNYDQYSSDALSGIRFTALLEDPQEDRALVDGGRVVTGWESFEVKTQPDEDLLLVIRLGNSVVYGSFTVFREGMRSITYPETTNIGVFIDENEPLMTTVDLQPEGFTETVISIPSAMLDHHKTRLTVSGDFTSFHYWVYQKLD